VVLLKGFQLRHPSRRLAQQCLSQVLATAEETRLEEDLTGHPLYMLRILLVKVADRNPGKVVVHMAQAAACLDYHSYILVAHPFLLSS
jgi:hypothetical protein